VVISSPGAGPTPLQEGVVSARVSMLCPISVVYAILYFHCAHDHAQGLGAGGGEPRDVNPPEDVARREAKHASNEKMWARREREIEREREHGAPSIGR
jgi:hypothetical protein